MKSQMEVTVELAGTTLSGSTVLQMLTPFIDAKKGPDGQLGIPVTKMPFSVFSNLLIKDGYLTKQMDPKTGEFW